MIQARRVSWGLPLVMGWRRVDRRSRPEDDHSLRMAGQCAEVLEIASQHRSERLGERDDDGIDRRTPTGAST